MFLDVSVSHSAHGGLVSQHVLQVSRPTPGGKLRGLAWWCLQAHTWWVSPGPHSGRGFPGPHPERVAGIPACTEADTSPPQQMATAEGGMHPTGMHSCWK